MRSLVFIVCVACLTSCYKTEFLKESRTIEVNTNPPNSDVWVHIDGGNKYLGRAPLSYTAKSRKMARKPRYWPFYVAGAGLIIGGLILGGVSGYDDSAASTIGMIMAWGGLGVIPVGGGFAIYNAITDPDVFRYVTTPSKVKFIASNGTLRAESKYASPWSLSSRLTLDLANAAPIVPAPGPSVAVQPPVSLPSSTGTTVVNIPAGSKMPVFVDDVRFKGFPARHSSELKSWSSALATEVSSGLEVGRGFAPMTMDNLKAQLGRERIKETMACATAACVNKIVENFGCPSSVFTTVRYINENRVQIYVTYVVNGEKMGAVGPAYTEMDFGMLASKLRDMAEELAKKIR